MSATPFTCALDGSKAFGSIASMSSPRKPIGAAMDASPCVMPVLVTGIPLNARQQGLRIKPRASTWVTGASPVMTNSLASDASARPKAAPPRESGDDMIPSKGGVSVGWRESFNVMKGDTYARIVFRGI
jgi:hypothetical protein